MEFIPAGEIIGDAHQVRTVRITSSPQLPDGEYCFLDMYCTDPSCDCRKTMIRVLHNGEAVSIINYGWESPSYYKQWFGADQDEDVPPMHGASIDITSPDKVSPRGMLGLFKALLDERWIEAFRKHYKAVKNRLAGKQMRQEHSRANKPWRRNLLRD